MKTLSALIMLVSIGLTGCHHFHHHDHGHHHDKHGEHCPPGQHKKGNC